MGKRTFREDLDEARRINARSGVEVVDPRNLDRLEAQYEELRELFEEQIASRRAGETGPLALRLHEGKAETDETRSILAVLQTQAQDKRQDARLSTQDAVRTEMMLAVLLGTLSLLTALGSILYVRRRLIWPLLRLRERARKVGEGDLNHRIDSRSRDEVGEVAAASNRMAERRKEAEEDLKKSDARARATPEPATDAIITMTADGMIRSFNPVAERIFCYPAGEVMERPMRMLMPERFRWAHEAGFRRYLAGGEARVVGKGAVELAGLRKDGAEFPLELSLGEMREEDEAGRGRRDGVPLTPPRRAHRLDPQRGGHGGGARQTPVLAGVHGGHHRAQALRGGGAAKDEDARRLQPEPARAAPSQYRRARGHRGALRGLPGDGT